ncbi:hypothetical protein A3A79_00090 [Candidatus Gottesmanbacteria bacterium RIFCSPLOWO2_01_FULL_43_11b]|uniref:Uncharacterized protein n=1 Tax=Candidatus Gottesmanbacteria bacterium RIFCSPLOWO2_01_FULL_43_11b TaxID=1798392 RepID=A0A1F6AFU3_9BACT|nr:MAG: hypothetical protein A3A79_00090 [Candidatus Gottesmanbacteria bacterium RIFCSPLOWO2_01_FULL_43_11b]
MGREINVLKYLPTFENEIGNKTIDEIRTLARFYDSKWTLYAYTGALEDLTPSEFQFIIKRRVQRLHYEANKRWAVQILRDSHASEDDIKAARNISWNVRINTLFDAVKPPKGSMNDDEYQQLCNSLFQKILEENPRPNGSIARLTSFGSMEDGDA